MYAKLGNRGVTTRIFHCPGYKGVSARCFERPFGESATGLIQVAIASLPPISPGLRNVPITHQVEWPFPTSTPQKKNFPSGVHGSTVSRFRDSSSPVRRLSAETPSLSRRGSYRIFQLPFARVAESPRDVACSIFVEIGQKLAFGNPSARLLARYRLLRGRFLSSRYLPLLLHTGDLSNSSEPPLLSRNDGGSRPSLPLARIFIVRYAASPCVRICSKVRARPMVNTRGRKACDVAGPIPKQTRRSTSFIFSR